MNTNNEFNVVRSAESNWSGELSDADLERNTTEALNRLQLAEGDLAHSDVANALEWLGRGKVPNSTMIGAMGMEDRPINKEVVQAAAEFVGAVAKGTISVRGNEDYYYDYVLPPLKYMKNEMENRGFDKETLDKVDNYMENQ